MDFSGLKIAEPDLYFSYWLSNLLPKLSSANPWLKKILQNYSPLVPTPQRMLKLGRLSHWAKHLAAKLLGGRWGDRWEAWAKNIQLDKISAVKKELAASGDGRVIISDQIIKLHENDRRLDYLRRWQEKTNSLLADVQA